MSGRADAVVLVSGGMDSLVTAAIAVRDASPAFLHISYGQRTERKEKECFRAIAGHYGVEHTFECDVSHLARIGGSSLTDPAREVGSDGVDPAIVPDTYVPFRNANLLAIAVSWAEVLGAVRVYVGAVEEDSSGYPDCRREFFDAFEVAARAGTARISGLEILTPLIELSKAEIVRRGTELGAPFELSWSCYQNSEKACGVCDSCRLRLKAFQDNELSDPIPYT